MTKQLPPRIRRADPEMILETKIEINNRDLRLRINLGPLALTQMMKSSKEGEVRGLMARDKVYYWDAFYATHQEVANALGITYHPEDRIHIWRVGEEDQDNEAKVLVDMSDPVTAPPPLLAGLAKSPNIYFCNPHGQWKNGMELAA